MQFTVLQQIFAQLVQKISIWRFFLTNTINNTCYLGNKSKKTNQCGYGSASSLWGQINAKRTYFNLFFLKNRRLNV
jgi:hypothetical protein